MFQQVFVPASKGLIKSAPSSLIPDGSFQEAVNVRFGDGYVEKVEGFKQVLVNESTGQSYIPNNQRITKIHVYRKKDGSMQNIMHTREPNESGASYVYKIDSFEDEPQLISGQDYKASQLGHINGVNAFDEYFFTSLGSDVYYWNGKESKVQRLEGTFSPQTWQANHEYTKGDIVKPTYDKYTGYVYKCTEDGISDNTEPTWVQDLVSGISDGSTGWIGCGSVDLEGQDDDHVSLQAHCIELFKGFLFLGNTVEGGDSYPTRLRWSQWQNPRLWHNNEDGSGLSGYVDVDDTDGKIMALKRIGDVLYVYKENSIIALTYTGDPDSVFSKEVVTTRAGVIAPEAIIELPHLNIFLGEDDIYTFDGNTCVGIGEPIKEWFFNKLLDKSTMERIFGYYDERNQEIVFCFNKNGETNKKFIDNLDYGLVYNLTFKTWSIREMGITTIGKVKLVKDVRIDDVHTEYDDESNNNMIDSAIYAGATTYTVMGDKNGRVFVQSDYTDERKPNTGYEGYVITKTHHMEEPGKIKRLMRIQLHIETSKNHNLYCQVGAAWNPENINEGDITWSEKKYLNLKKPVPWYTHHIVPYIDVDMTARYFVLRFGTTGNDTYFKVLGYTLYYQVRGDE